MFCRLTKSNLAPEAFLIKDKNYSVISCSPETLIEKKGRSIITKPIAGTLTKNKSLNKSKALQYFRKNIKETKEHNMIVDMERSDLSRICVPGSVKIKKEKTVEEYKDLFHYVSLIKGKLNEKAKTIDIVKSMMPGGSVIGCPKISTLNLLNKQEKENRNIYTGSFGYIKFNGDMRFNIIIRSILNFKNTSEISVASGVVIDSNANHEFNENFIKAKAWPSTQVFWRNRLDQVIDWLIDGEAERRKNAEPIGFEASGRLVIPELNFTIRAIADRVDQRSDGSFVIYDYKTGVAPTEKQQLYFDKQLYLLALVAEHSGFAKIEPNKVFNAAFVGLGNPAKIVNAPFEKESVEEAYRKLRQLIERYQDPDQGFTARRALFKSDDFSDYDHLSRYGEWDVSHPPKKERLQ